MSEQGKKDDLVVESSPEAKAILRLYTQRD